MVKKKSRTGAAGGTKKSGATKKGARPSAAARPAQRKRKARVIAANATNYPKYKLILEGDDPTRQKFCEGPHTESVRIGTPELDVKVEVANNETSNGPILTIKISRE